MSFRKSELSLWRHGCGSWNSESEIYMGIYKNDDHRSMWLITHNELSEGGCAWVCVGKRMEVDGLRNLWLFVSRQTTKLSWKAMFYFHTST